MMIAMIDYQSSLATTKNWLILRWNYTELLQSYTITYWLLAIGMASDMKYLPKLHYSTRFVVNQWSYINYE